eukprot:3281687-Heterocapsa_arctica.AAC.1
MEARPSAGTPTGTRPAQPWAGRRSGIPSPNSSLTGLARCASSASSRGGIPAVGRPRAWNTR